MKLTMTIKRTYRVEFDSYTRECIEGAKKGVYVMYGWHDLLDHSHPDDQFMALDPASNRTGMLQCNRKKNPGSLMFNTGN